MKIILVVFLSAFTLVACSVPEVFVKSQATATATANTQTTKPPGSNCICKKKECTDVSCEEKNCLCMVVSALILFIKVD